MGVSWNAEYRIRCDTCRQYKPAPIARGFPTVPQAREFVVSEGWREVAFGDVWKCKACLDTQETQ